MKYIIALAILGCLVIAGAAVFAAATVKVGAQAFALTAVAITMFAIIWALAGQLEAYENVDNC